MNLINNRHSFCFFKTNRFNGFLFDCPQGIPLHLFNRKFIKDIDEFYGEFQAGVDPEAKSPLTSFTFNDVEPGVTGGRR